MDFYKLFILWLYVLSPDVLSITYSDEKVRLTPRNARDYRGDRNDRPMFVGEIENVTVPAGRSVKMSCTTKNLGEHRVAWMHFQESVIMAVHSYVVTRNRRITVSQENNEVWNLHISSVRPDDGGMYMCQINTPIATTQTGYLNVVVPPDIDDALTSSDMITREGSNVTLTCSATGSPPPSIRWRRDDGQNINVNKTLSVTEWVSNTLDLTRISRLDMGAYLCIASNGVPPSVSKRIRLNVDFPPMLSIPHQLVSAPIGYNVTLECFTEAHPNSLNYWTRGDGQMIHEGKKYHIQSTPLEVPYKTQMKLTIYKLRQMDLGTYKCVAKNPRGETDGSIRLYESALMTSTAQSTLEDGNDKDTQIEISSTYNRTNEMSNAKFDKGTKIQSTFNTIEKVSNKEREDHQKIDQLGRNNANNVPGNNVACCTIICIVAMSIVNGKIRMLVE